MSGTSSKKQKWFPLESNPTLINQYIENLGFDTSKYEFVDLFSTEEWALEMIPQPVVAVIMLYPLSDAQESHRSSDVIASEEIMKDKVWFIKQRIGNACGTIGLLHSLLNIPKPLQGSTFKANSWMHSFANDCPISMSPINKAEILEGDQKVASLHDQATSSELNQTNRGNIEDNVITHFISIVNVDNTLYEMDGRKDGPVLHGNTSPETLLQDAANVVKKFMTRDPDEMRFTILALAPKAT